MPLQKLFLFTIYAEGINGAYMPSRKLSQLLQLSPQLLCRQLLSDRRASLPDSFPTAGKFQRLIRLSIVGREGVIVKEDSVDLSKNRNRINSL